MAQRVVFEGHEQNLSTANLGKLGVDDSLLEESLSHDHRVFDVVNAEPFVQARLGQEKQFVLEPSQLGKTQILLLRQKLIY